jgi:phage gp36-like protein
MSYCTQQQLIDRPNGEQELIQLTDTGNQGVINATVLNQAIAAADAEIDSYLTAFLPLASIPPRLIYVAMDITLYYLYQTRMLEPVEKRYTAAIRYLDAVRQGKDSLGPGVAAGSEIAPGETGVEYLDVASVFGGDALSGF